MVETTINRSLDSIARPLKPGGILPTVP